MMMLSNNVTVGFGTAGLGGMDYNVVTHALNIGFRRFDTAEADWWYDQASVGRALRDFFTLWDDDGCIANGDCKRTCASEKLKISTKIPPWSLTSATNIRQNAAQSRQTLVGFCEEQIVELTTTNGQVAEESRPFPLDIYYIHAPRCWNGWHPRCRDPPPALQLREAWLGMEAVVGLDHSAERIGLSNISPTELLDIIRFVQERQQQVEESMYPPPRMPDVVQAFADPLSQSKQLRQICEQNGIEFVSYSTLGTQHRGGGQNPVLGSPTIRQLASKYERSTAEVVLSWALQRNMSVIPRSGKKKHIHELARLLKGKTFLTVDDLALIDRMEQ